MGTTASGRKRPHGVLEHQYTACFPRGYRQLLTQFDGGEGTEFGEWPAFVSRAKGLRGRDQVRAAVSAEPQERDRRPVDPHGKLDADALVLVLHAQAALDLTGVSGGLEQAAYQLTIRVRRGSHAARPGASARRRCTARR